MKNANTEKTLNLKTKQALRKKLLDLRKNFPEAQQKANANCILNKLTDYAAINLARHIAAYFSANGEVEITKFLQILQKTGKKCYVPVISSKERKEFFFAPWDESKKIKVNCYGINEPVCTPEEYINTHKLDVVLTPLVAFDRQGNRLGMGGGFYDNIFFGKEKWSHVPLLIGLAHEFQYIAEGIPADSWDVKLDAVFTEKNIYHFS